MTICVMLGMALLVGLVIQPEDAAILWKRTGVDLAGRKYRTDLDHNDCRLPVLHSLLEYLIRSAAQPVWGPFTGN